MSWNPHLYCVCVVYNRCATGRMCVHMFTNVLYKKFRVSCISYVYTCTQVYIVQTLLCGRVSITCVHVCPHVYKSSAQIYLQIICLCLCLPLCLCLCLCVCLCLCLCLPQSPSPCCEDLSVFSTLLKHAARARALSRSCSGCIWVNLGGEPWRRSAKQPPVIRVVCFV
jgi:hypothetical protein